MRDVRLLRAFFESLRSDGVRIGVEDEARMRVLFATRHEWDLTTVHVALRSLLVHDPHQRASFDRHFEAFFSVKESTAGFSAEQLRLVLDDLRNVGPDLPGEKDPESRLSVSIASPESTGETPVTQVPQPWTDRWRRVPGLARIAGVGAAVLLCGVFAWRFLFPPPPPPPPPTVAVPVFQPSSLFLKPPAEGERSSHVIRLTNPDKETSFEIQRLEVRDLPESGGVEISLDHPPLPHRLLPEESLVITITVQAAQKDSWSARVQAVIEGIQPSKLAVIVDTRPDWTPDPWGHLVALDWLTIETRPLEPDRRWLAWLGAAAVFLAAGGAYAGWLLYWQRLRLPPLPTPQPDDEGCGFSIASIGGPRAPVVSAKRARRLADMLGQTASDEATRRLDLPRTVERTSRAGGFPQFAWQADRITRRVLILEDARIDPACVSGAIDDLQRGLERTGVDVQRVWFREGIGRFADARGGVRELRELAAWRQQTIVLVHTDGSGFHYRAERDSLAALAEWPHVAVLDPRSPDRRDPATDPLAAVTLARFDANETGIARAFRSFVDRSRRDVARPVSAGRGRRARAADIADPEREVAAVLGDSLMWAADCVWLQPCSRALAEALRQRFHPDLPTDRLQRILALRGTRSDADGFRYGVAVRGALRAIWKRRRTEGERREVLDFIQQQIDDAEPAERDSTAHLAWEAIRERFLLESRPGHSPRRMAELAPLLAPYLRESLHGFRISRPDERRKGSGVVFGLRRFLWGKRSAENDSRPPAAPPAASDLRTVLETDCDDPKSLQYLASIGDELGIPLIQRLPWSHWQRTALGLLGSAALVCLIGMIAAVVNSQTQYWEITDTTAQPFELFQLSAVGQEQNLGTWGQDWTAQRPVPRAGRDYRVVARGGDAPLQTEPHRYVSGQLLSIAPVSDDVPPEEQPPWQQFVWIPPGTFLMGSPESEVGRLERERQHEVTLTRGFFLGATEVTQRQYQDVMGVNPSRFTEAGLDAPVETVSWDDATEFCRRLTDRERREGRLRDGWEFRLPTESQWEYACRAGTTTAYSFGDDPAQLDQYGWYLANSNGRTHRVATKQPNAFGLYDMHGNVWEWCQDWFGEYQEATVVDPVGPDTGQARVVRGGGWGSVAEDCRSAVRAGGEPGRRGGYLGFRVAAVRVDEFESVSEGESVKRAQD